MTEQDTKKSKENHGHDPAYASFFRHARKNCCNYSDKGPGGKSHYCWAPPVIQQNQCVIPYGQECRWFERAVLPLDRELLAEWHRLMELKAETGDHPEVRQERVCPCGTRFTPRSQRNIHCQECLEAQRWESRYRAQQKKGMKNADSGR
jgi:hypothetical protein